jgi:hypothetical protein
VRLCALGALGMQWSPACYWRSLLWAEMEFRAGSLLVRLGQVGFVVLPVGFALGSWGCLSW